MVKSTYFIGNLSVKNRYIVFFSGNTPNMIIIYCTVSDCMTIIVHVCIVWQSTDYTQWYVAVGILQVTTWVSPSTAGCGITQPSIHPVEVPSPSDVSSEDYPHGWYPSPWLGTNKPAAAKNIRKYYILKRYVFKTFTYIYYVDKK